MTGRLKKFCGVSVKQDVEVRATDVIRSDVCGGRTAALAIANGTLYPAEADLFPEININQRKYGKGIVMKRTAFPVFMSRWKGKTDAKAGSVAAATTFESIGCVYPGRLMDTIPFRLCADGRY